MNILIDGVFFQLNNTGIARVWASIIPYLYKKPDITIYVLDRGGVPDFDGVTRVPFPSMQFINTPQDSELIQNVCDELKIDVFTSSYYTTPLTTPTVSMVYDMIPELFDFDLSHRPWQEKELALLHATNLVAISQNTKDDVLSLYPEIAENNIDVAYCGVDRKTFKQYSTADLAQFKKEFGLKRDYFLFVGSRTQHTGYKNCTLFFDALAKSRVDSFDILCVGGDEVIEEEIVRKLPKKINIKRVVLTDIELAKAYNGALALVYPSLYEGFGMPVIEALACQCNVITTHNGSLKEAAGEVCHLVSGLDVDEMLKKLEMLATQKPKLDADLVEQHLSQFDWETMASKFYHSLAKSIENPRSAEFHNNWSRLRKIQAAFELKTSVDV